MRRNDTIIQSIKDEFVNEAEQWHKKRNIAEEYYSYKKLLNFLRDLADMSNYATKVQGLESLPALQKYFKEEEAFAADEAQQLLEFRTHLSRADQAWWDDKISGLKKLAGKDTNSPISIESQRMLGYLSLVMYMGADGEFKQRNYPACSYFLGLYSQVDPANPEHSYLSACVDMANNESDKALNMLNDAVKLGFSDMRRLQQDSNFVLIHNTAGYKKIINEIASNPKKLDITQ